MGRVRDICSKLSGPLPSSSSFDGFAAGFAAVSFGCFVVGFAAAARFAVGFALAAGPAATADIQLSEAYLQLAPC